MATQLMKNKQVEPPRYRFGDWLQTPTHKERVYLKNTLSLWGLLRESLNRLATIVARRCPLGDSDLQKRGVIVCTIAPQKGMRVGWLGK